MFTQIETVAFRALPVALGVVLIAAFLTNLIPVAHPGPAFATPVETFEWVATYDVPSQVAEIIASTPDGETLIYTDSASEEIGFVTIAEPQHPANGGTLEMPGEPTSVAVTPDGMWALVAVHETNQDALVVVDLDARTIKTTIALGGQPDSVAISPVTTPFWSWNAITSSATMPR